MRVKLKEVFDLQMGKTPARNNVEFWDGTHKWISISDLGNAGKYIDSTKERISDEGIKSSGIKVVPKGTVVMSFKLSIGKVAITTEDMYTNEAIMAFLSKGMYEIDVDYLYYLCCGTNWNIGTNKAVMGLTLNKATLSEYEIGLPDISEQHKIVRNLDKLDILISKRKEQVATLDNLTKSRFIEMFGNPITNEKSWKVSEFSKLCTAIGDGLHGTPVYDDEGQYPFINGNNLRENKIEITPETRRVGQEMYDKHFIDLDNTTVMLSINGTLGKTALYNGETVILGKSACYSKVGPLLDREFVLAVFLSDAFQQYMQDNCTGTTIKNFGLKALRTYPMIVPPIDEQHKYVQFMRQVDKSKLAVQKSLEELETLKKSLMQEYFG